MNSSQMLIDGVSDARAWRTSTIDDAKAWYYPLSEDCISSFEHIIQDARRQLCDRLQRFPIRLPLSNGCGECLQPALDELNSGRGFAIVERVPIEQYSGGRSAVHLLADWSIPWQPDGAEY